MLLVIGYLQRSADKFNWILILDLVGKYINFFLESQTIPDNDVTSNLDAVWYSLSSHGSHVQPQITHCQLGNLLLLGKFSFQL